MAKDFEQLIKEELDFLDTAKDWAEDVRRKMSRDTDGEMWVADGPGIPDSEKFIGMVGDYTLQDAWDYMEDHGFYNTERYFPMSRIDDREWRILRVEHVGGLKLDDDYPPQEELFILSERNIETQETEYIAASWDDPDALVDLGKRRSDDQPVLAGVIIRNYHGRFDQFDHEREMYGDGWIMAGEAIDNRSSIEEVSALASKKFGIDPNIAQDAIDTVKSWF